LNPTFFAKLLIPILLCLAAVGLFLNYFSSPDINFSNQCAVETGSACTLIINHRLVSVEFLQTIEVEEELALSITTSDNIQIKEMWVQGVNMYMGKSAVLSYSVYAQDAKMVYKSRLFLGSCSEPAMKWQLVIQTVDDKQVKQSWFYNFSTDRNKKG
jgi:hypothetical protein